MNERTKMRLGIAVACTTTLTLAFGCVGAVRDVGYESPQDGGAGSIGFVSPADGSTSDGQAAPVVPMCVSTECPYPYATCLDKSGLCNTNLNNDLKNCGACGNKCQFEAGASTDNATLLCENGKCGVICESQTADCNGKLEDGCEVNLRRDPLNCGGCGNACKGDEICWRGACGCPPGYTQCGDSCTQLDRDAKNCSACGTECGIPDDDADPRLWPCEPGVLPPHIGPVCSDSECKLDCVGDLFGIYLDCNSDRCGDGCETNVANDPKNCGGCGHTCLPEQVCISGECQCDAPQLTFCSGCTDLMKDPYNCGACGHACPGLKDSFQTSRTGNPICVLGRCSYYCPPGRADCDHRVENGCEIDLMVDPENCGGCGVHCDLDSGQSCAAGSCLTKPCESDGGGVH
jgi:hypothetical protein